MGMGDIVWIVLLSLPLLGLLTVQVTTLIRSYDRDRQRDMLHQLASRKLDVLEAAVKMGYDQEEVAELSSNLDEAVETGDLKQVLKSRGGSQQRRKPGAQPAGATENADDVGSQRHRKGRHVLSQPRNVSTRIRSKDLEQAGGGYQANQPQTEQ